ncbi:phosphopantothenoylcysteine decarboxylase [Exophiala aquamarina CBS 119918]|uniref:Phosphopantothenoylcysteine decarboxylase n=1 Tax=Exophiala aquamarina CBS 119918 TaxID=1182545 RepID=A0A072NU53_9EURO|nr:phosphopantothenoylcysteine decarboxylase [Exophiala aquamarina CBS 119918]KEF51161.1 phosphopantothenoylcysteine decarboxylase [Exophiala aquamarina CBS 119918]
MSAPTAPQEAFSAENHFQDGKHHVLLAATGSVATIKIPLIAKSLARHPNISIRILLTPSAEEFLQGQASEQPCLASLLDLDNLDGIYHDRDEWAKPWVRGDKILHIELRRWAHVLLVAPLSANSLAKMVNGISDGLLLSVIRAWDTTGLIDVRRKRIFVAPAMNTAMWRHPITKKQIKVLEQDWGDGENGWITVLRPIEKELACGDVGDGAMLDWKLIVEHIESHLGIDLRKQDGAVNGS